MGLYIYDVVKGFVTGEGGGVPGEKTTQGLEKTTQAGTPPRWFQRGVRAKLPNFHTKSGVWIFFKNITGGGWEVPGQKTTQALTKTTQAGTPPQWFQHHRYMERVQKEGGI